MFPNNTNDMYCIHNFAVAGSGNGKQKISLDIPINLVPGKNSIDLLGVTVGLAVSSLPFLSANYCLFGIRIMATYAP